MASTRKRFDVPSEIQDQLDDFCSRTGMPLKAAVNTALCIGLTTLDRAMQPASNDTHVMGKPAQPEQPASVPEARKDVGDLPVALKFEGMSAWFRADDVCHLLGIQFESVLGEIDPEDDTAVIDGCTWLSRRALSEALAMCRDYDLADQLKDWADQQMKSITFPTTA